MRVDRICLFLVLVGTGYQSLNADIIETFSGTGPHTTTNTGLPGFENPGWFQLGTVGQFTTNSSGDQVFSMNTIGSPEDGFSRALGRTGFDASLEVVNLNYDAGGTQFAAGTGLYAWENYDGNGVYGAAGLGVYELNGEYSVVMAWGIGTDSGVPYEHNLGSSVSRIELFLEYRQDLINGGGLFSASYELDNSGNRITLGTIDGTIYTNASQTNREFFMNSFGNQESYGEFNHFTFTAVPEPSFGIGLALSCLVGAVRWRRKAEFV